MKVLIADDESVFIDGCHLIEMADISAVLAAALRADPGLTVVIEPMANAHYKGSSSCARAERGLPARSENSRIYCAAPMLCWAGWIIMLNLSTQPRSATRIFMHTSLRLLMITAFLLGAPVASASESDPFYIHDLVCNGGRLGLRLPPTAAGVRKLGKIVASQPIEVQQWDGYRTSARALRYRGLTLEIITFSNDANRYLIEAATLQHPRWKRLSPFYVGQSREEVYRVLGVQDSAPEAEQLEFGGDADTLRFSFRSGRLAQLQYICYTG